MKPFFTYIPASEILKSFFRTQCDENKFEGTPAIDSIVFFCRQDRIHGKNSVCFFGYFGGGDIQRPTQCVSGVQWRFFSKSSTGVSRNFAAFFKGNALNMPAALRSFSINCSHSRGVLTMDCAYTASLLNTFSSSREQFESNRGCDSSLILSSQYNSQGKE